MQKVMLIGYLGRDPEVKYSQQGTAIAQFSVATSERWKDKEGELQEHTEWFAVKTFGRRAEIVGEHLHKGSRVYLEGRKRTESWDDKQTGAKHYRDLVYIDRIEFLDSKSGGMRARSSKSHAGGISDCCASPSVVASSVLAEFPRSFCQTFPHQRPRSRLTARRLPLTDARQQPFEGAC
jgi:single-strand DNA-binding protein